MARIRSIKPEFFTSEQVVECSPSARLLFVGMWVFADDGGVHPASVKRLKMEVFPGDSFSDQDVRALVDELMNANLIVEYEAEGQRYWWVPSWDKHQKIDKPTYRFPRPFGEESTTPRRVLPEESPTPRVRSRMESSRYKEEENTHTAHASDTKPPPTRVPSEAALSPSGEFLTAESEAFLKFYRAYPRKSGKAKAWRAWQAVVIELVSKKRVTDAEAEAFLVDRAERYAGTPAGQPTADGQDFRPFPATWLQDGHYDDELQDLQTPNGTTRTSESRSRSKRPTVDFSAFEEFAGLAPAATPFTSPVHEQRGAQ